MLSEQARFIRYNDGYKDGYRLKDKRASNSDYIAGYNKGKADKEFVDSHTDESIGIYD